MVAHGASTGIDAVLCRNLDAELIDIDVPVYGVGRRDDLVIANLLVVDDVPQEVAFDLDGRRGGAAWSRQHVALERIHLHDDERTLSLERVVAVPECGPFGHNGVVRIVELAFGELAKVVSLFRHDA